MEEKMIEKQDVEYLAKLAKLELNETQKALFLKQLNDILAFFHQLNELDTEDIEPTSYILPSSNLFHDDIPRPSLPQKTVLSLTRHQKNGYIRVPRILNQ